MTYEVDVLPGALRAIRKLPPDGRRRVQATLELLAVNPRPPAAKKLVGVPRWRARSGDYRIVYEIEDRRLLVTVVRAGHRREIYENR